MTMICTRVILILFAGLVLVDLTSFAQAEDGSQCNLAPIVQPLDMAGVQGEPRPDSLEMRFSLEDYEEEIDGNTFQTKVVLPSLDLISDISSFVDAKLQNMESAIREEVDKNKLSFAGWRVQTVTPQGADLLIQGEITVRKYAKFDWMCCHWFSCHRCRKEVRLFQRTVPFTASVSRSIQLVPTRIYSKVLQEVGDRMKIVTSPADYPVRLELSATGSSRGDTSALEDLYDFVAGFFEFVKARLFGGKPKWQMKDWISQTFSESFDGPNPYVFQQKLYTFAHIQQSGASTPRPISQRWFWQSFVAGMKLDYGRTAFSSVNGRNKFISAFYTDYQEYAKYLNRLGFGESGVVVDYLNYKNFCALGGRKVLEDFMESLKRDFEGKSVGPSEAVIPKGHLTQGIRDYFGAWGLDEFIKSSHRVVRSSNGKSWSVSFPDLASISSSRILTPINGNLWSMDAEQGWSREERDCINILVLKRSGSLNKIYPAQDFSECLESPGGLSADQEKALDVVGADTGAFSAASGTVFGPPIVGGSNYRGWYYCYTTSSLCAGRQRIIWTQRESLFGARGGRHGGVDIFDSNGDDENIPISAISDGKLIYNNLDPTEWGNALILPFRKDNKNYYAVYAHLPSSSKSLDGKQVKLGDNIGIAGCTGNAGDGKGNCNNYCLVNGGGRSDIHLHFETIEIGDDGKRKKVDPTTILNFVPSKNSDIRLYACDQTSKMSDLGR
ncbi:M23 family metallopeptidase [Aestuariivirga sp.]|uniref:M23 family metallopeptidase n=1 Tax=Aestuariivirga sp. TaxID=2650926 RepID=UPI003BAAB474